MYNINFNIIYKYIYVYFKNNEILISKLFK